MALADSIARPLLAGVFVYGGVQTLRRPEDRLEVAEPVLTRLSEVTGQAPQRLVAINAGVQVGAGLALAAGVLARPAAVVLAASLVPTTLGGHRFWEHADAARTAHTVHFLKNLATFGGLVLAAASTGGRPSVPWLTRRAARRVVEGTADTLEHLRDGR